MAQPNPPKKRIRDQKRRRRIRDQSRRDKEKPANADDGNAAADANAAPGELLTGEGDPGLTLTGGSGHA